MTVSTDGHLPGALDRLYAAVAALVDERKELLGDVIRAAPSLYAELYAEVRGTLRRGGNHGVRQARSVVPLWLDGMELLDEIDTAIEAWTHSGSGSTPTRLRALASRRWRPMDCRGLDQMTQIVNEWCVQVDALLHPQRVKRISAPCPACNSTHVYRRDSAGEVVRQPALQVIAATGCTCQSCHATWTPDLYLHLCLVLGFDMPEGFCLE